MEYLLILKSNDHDTTNLAIGATAGFVTAFFLKEKGYADDNTLCNFVKEIPGCNLLSLGAGILFVLLGLGVGR